MVPPPENRPSVYAFLDAREFLRQAYKARRAVDRRFSQRFIALALRAGSSSFFLDLLSGKSKFTPSRVAGFAKLFRLNKTETHYFEQLVAYSEAENPEEKSQALSRLRGMESRGQRRLLEASHAEYFSKWHYAAVRELLAVYDFTGDYATLGNLLNPPLPEATARAAVELLESLMLIRKTAHGGYEPTEQVVMSGPGNGPAQMRTVLLNHLDLARRALDVVPAASRPFSYLTVSVSERSFALIHEKLRALRDEVFDLITRDHDVDRLYQLNVQFFPVSDVIARRKK
jgi:uncharacterized protein (TIGR02147 family)